MCFFYWEQNVALQNVIFLIYAWSKNQIYKHNDVLRPLGGDIVLGKMVERKSFLWIAMKEKIVNEVLMTPLYKSKKCKFERLGDEQ